MYFECINGYGKKLIVNCDSTLAGQTITCSKENFSLTAVCPSIPPYTITFYGLENGTWTITSNNQTVNVTIKDERTLLRYNRLNWFEWLVTGDLNPDDYNSLQDVLSDEKAIRQLMLIKNSADYLIAAVTEDITIIDEFCEHDVTMKWIGLCDYVCEGLTAIAGVEEKFLASEYWERYLKDHIPIMTSNSSPYGSAFSTSAYSSSHPAWRAFDGQDYNETQTRAIFTRTNGGAIGYFFMNLIWVKKLKVSGCTINVPWKVQGSLDGSSYVDLTETFTNTDYTQTLDIPVTKNGGYYLYYRITNTSTASGESGYGLKFQAYGRALNITVPTLSSNTAPYGEAFCKSGDIYNGYGPFGAFNKNNTNTDSATYHTQSTSGHFVGYDFKKPICVRGFRYKQCYQSYSGRNVTRIDFKGSNDRSTWTTIYTTTSLPSWGGIKSYTFSNNTSYKNYACFLTLSGGSDYTDTGIVQFYGIDLSAKEFEPNTTKKWLYDHGVDLSNLQTDGTAHIGDEYLTLSAVNDQIYTNINLSNYSILRCRTNNNLNGTSQLMAGTTTYTLIANDAPDAHGINIASLTSTVNTGIKMTAAGKCEVNELWLD